MKRSLKKIMALLVAMIMVMSMGMTAFAATTLTESNPVGSIPSDRDTGVVNIEGLKQGDTVKFYQIVKANYDTTKDTWKENFSGYELIEAGTIADIEKPTAAEITALAENNNVVRDANQKGGTQTAGTDGKVSATLPVGEYIAIATSKDQQTVYNPMVVSVYYTSNGSKVTSGSISADDTFTINGTSSYIKSTDITIDKTIEKDTEDGTDKNVATSAKNKNGDDVAIGDVLTFNVASTIPSYSDEYTTESIKYIVSDKMDAGLTLDTTSIKVYIGGSETALSGDDLAAAYEVTKTADHEFELTFKPAWIKAQADKTDAQRKIKVEYKATVNDNATVNFDENNNTATIEFTQDPDETKDAKKITDETHQYTFEIDGNVAGSQESYVHRMHELIKTNENGMSDDEKALIDDGTIKEDTVTNPLAGAIFELKNTATNHTYYAESDAGGLFGASENKYNNNDIKGFKGLEAGNYTLKEVQAPEGYSLDATEHTVVISCTFDDDGILTSYTITIDEENTSTYNVTYDSENPTVVKEVTPAEGSAIIKNTKLPGLPSTGGMGTALFTFIGVLFLAISASLYVMKRRKMSV